MSTNISIPTYGFVNHILALNEGNWRRFFKPFITDSVQSGLATIAGANMTVYVSAGECRCGAVMGILDEMVALDVANGDSTYNRIDSVIVQYTYGEPSTLAVAIVQGTPSANPVPPTLTKVYDTLWQMEIAQILVPSGATSSSEFTITDKRVIYESIESIIDDNTESEERVWSSQKTREEIVSLSTEIYDSLNTKADAITMTASGDIVTITDGADNIPVKELVVGIDPVQDLHGYDNPWPAGGGKNLCNAIENNLLTYSNSYKNYTFSNGNISITGNTLAGFIIPVKPSTQYTASFKKNNSESVYLRIREYKSIPTDWAKNDEFIVQSIDNFVSGTNASGTFTTTAETTYILLTFYRNGVPASTIILSDFQLELGSSATSYAPYSNICPISGHTNAVVTRTGKNLFDKSNRANIGFGTGIIVSSGTFFGYYIECKEGETYTLSRANGTATPRFSLGFTAELPTNETPLLLREPTNYNNTVTKVTLTAPTGAKYVCVYLNNNGTTIPDDANVQLELGSTATAYEPYQPIQQVAVQFPATLQNPEGAYYGGNVNLSTGILTIDRIKKKVGNYAWSKNTGTHIFYSNIDRTIKPQTPIICSEYKSVSWEIEEDNMPDLSIKLGTAENNQQQICIRDDRYSNASTFKSDMSDAEFVYYLNEPTIMHLHPQQISTLLGFNIVFADSGDILELIYRADMKTYVDEQVAEANIKTRQMMTTVTTEMIAPDNLVIGDIVIVNDDLYKVINSNIASGEAMVVGTNVEQITLTEYIQSLI